MAQDTLEPSRTIDNTTLGATALARLTHWYRWTQRVGFGRRLTIILMVMATVAGLMTGIVLTGAAGLEFGPGGVLALLVIDMILLLGLGGSVTWVLVRLWAARRSGAAGARIHVRLVTLFALLAVVPAITVVTLAAVFFNFEVRTWFNDKVRTAVTESVQVAEAYLAEHKLVITGDVFGMAKDMERDWTRIISNPRYAVRAINNQAGVRRLSEAILFDASGNTIARTDLAFALELDRPPFWAIEQATDGELVVLTSENEDRVRALVKLDTVPEAFLYVGRLVDSSVLRHMQRTQLVADQYAQLESRRAGIQWTLASIFVLVALLLLLTAVGLGLMFANRLARPISSLVDAAGRVRSGDLSVRLDAPDRGDELGTLTRAFNRMTEQLQEQRQELIEANRQLDERRKFTEAVLGGVSAGVIGLDQDGIVNFPNKSAVALLETKRDQLIGRRLTEVFPEMAKLIDRARRKKNGTAEGQITLRRADGTARTLLASAIAERAEAGAVIGFVTTFDDVTELLSAQRKAAWADIARRIAHEMKNPLTPIQLSAERLKRKYLKEIQSDPDTFTQCTDTIVRQVGDIGRMVDEFSSFARMPRPVMQDEDLGVICREALLLQRNTHVGVKFELGLPEGGLRWRCDRRLISQALTNLLKNGVESIEGRLQSDPTPGEIEVTVRMAGRRARIDVADNGKGLPAKERDRLTEPYVTTRSKGTGLGLAIVRKIMEDHGGAVELSERDPGGAVVSLIFGPTQERR